ncbi:hypothetical protein KO361_05120 [Candidatus Woesearchaeota archaeon]|nr:hypothetical protein [Candidatus Woesearchaeota archaeon]
MRKKAIALITILSFMLAVFASPSNFVMKEEVEGKELGPLWDNTEVLMPIDKFQRLYPEAIAFNPYENGIVSKEKYFKFPKPRIIGNIPFQIQFYFFDDQLWKVSLTLIGQGRIGILSNYAETLYKALEMKYGTQKQTFEKEDFSFIDHLSATWELNLADISFNYWNYDSNPHIELEYKVNYNRMQAYLVHEYL